MRRRLGMVAAAAAISLAVTACGGATGNGNGEASAEPERSGSFQLNPGEFYCHGYKETSPGDALLQTGDHYWFGAAEFDCPSI
jgi:hypothetical protein